MKNFCSVVIKNILTLVGLAFLIVSLIVYTSDTAKGIKTGFDLLANNLIPSLFPFMVLSSYVSQSGISVTISRLLEKAFNFIFKASGYGFVCFALGVIGGYPVGAKTVAEFYADSKISLNDAQRLMYWCINPSPAFTITAVGTFMLCNTQAGVLIYISCLLASVTPGFFCRFISDNSFSSVKLTEKAEADNALVKSVTKGSEAMLGVCGWVLTFCVLAALCDSLKLPYTLSCIIKSVGEVTTGCKNAISTGLSLPVIAGIVGFGGFAVICQCSGYAGTCKVKMKHLICSRLIIASLSSIFCSALLEIFPQHHKVSVTLGTGVVPLTLYHSTTASIILLIMCIVLILEVDNRKKMC